MTGSKRGQIVGKEWHHGPEVLGLVHALDTGHDGSLSNWQANSARDAVHRLETLVMQAAPTWPLAAVRSHLHCRIDAIVYVERAAGGRLTWTFLSARSEVCVVLP